MALARVKTWVASEVLTAADLNGEINNLLNNPIALISPLTGNVDVDGFDLIDADEVEFRDAAAQASVAGRLRRNGANLTWHDGTAVVNLNATGSVGIAVVKGASGSRNANTPNTQYDILCDQVVLRAASGSLGMLAFQNPSVVVCNFASDGANGRDQNSAFPASSWVHLYYIASDTANLYTLASANPPATNSGTAGPGNMRNTTHWAYYGAVRFTADSQIATTSIRGDYCAYATLSNLIDTASGATAETFVSITSIVPPNAKSYIVGWSGVAAGAEQFEIRHVSGSGFIHQRNHVAGDATYTGNCEIPNTRLGGFYYLETVARSIQINLQGYKVNNGG